MLSTFTSAYKCRPVLSPTPRPFSLHCRERVRGELAPGEQLVSEVHHGQGLVRQRQAGLQEPQRRAGLAHHAEEGGLCPEGAADHERGGKEEE